MTVFGMGSRRAVARVVLAALIAAAGLIAGPAPAQADRLADVKAQGYLRCGVTARQPGFSELTPDGGWKGFNIDICRAVAAAVLGDAEAIEILPVWLESLGDDEIDLLVAGATWTQGRETTQGVLFTSPVFYDGQGFIAHKSLDAKSLAEVKNARVCAVSTTATTGSNLADYIEQKDLNWELVPHRTLEGVWSAFVGRHCDMASHDRTALMSMRIGSLTNPEDYVVFPEVISKEPLTPAVRDDDKAWFDIVRWTTFALIAAEEYDLTSDNVDAKRQATTVPEIRRLLGVEGAVGPNMDLDPRWAYRVVRQVGNYGEIFERNLGKSSPFELDRGLNALWTDGGLMYAPPFR